MLEYRHLDELIKWCDEVEKDVKGNIRQRNVYNTGALYNSVRCELDLIDDDKLLIQYTMANYGYYQDEGVRGANPSKIGGIQKAPQSRFKFGSGKSSGGNFNKSIKKWMVQKGITPTGKVSRDALAFLITRSIYLQGLKPRDFFRRYWTQKLKEVFPLYGRGIISSIEEEFINIIKPYQ